VADRYNNFAALAAAEQEGANYRITGSSRPGARWASIAIHGGGVEAGSGEMARQVAAAGGMAHYEFLGLKSADNSVLHITSTNFDEPQALALVAASRQTLSFHGFAGVPGIAETALGGLDGELVARVGNRLDRAGFAVVTAPSEIAGSNLGNICNRNSIGAGVQLEMSHALRQTFFPGGDLSRTMRESGRRTDVFRAYAAAVGAARTDRGLGVGSSANVSRYCLVPAPSPEVDLTAEEVPACRSGFRGSRSPPPLSMSSRRTGLRGT
jgi:phage replication-related protein YjqB (UPF0714/DUF867 family)